MNAEVTVHAPGGKNVVSGFTPLCSEKLLRQFTMFAERSSSRPVLEAGISTAVSQATVLPFCLESGAFWISNLETH